MKKLILSALLSLTALPLAAMTTGNKTASSTSNTEVKQYPHRGGDKVIAACLEKTDGSGQCKKSLAASDARLKG